MKVRFSNVDFGSRTGPNTFASRLATVLMRRGHVVQNDASAGTPCDVMLAFIEAGSQPPPGCKVVQRLDGIWLKPSEFETHNSRIKSLYTHADHVIWQSNFDRNVIEGLWGPRMGSVVSNGIELKRATPYDRTGVLAHDPLLICSANWHPQKRLLENIKLLEHIQKSSPNAGLLVLGSVSTVDFDAVLRHVGGNINQRPGLRFLGNLSHEECLRLYATADWMIHLAWIDHCPNTVVESLSQCCPVICTDSGGTQELVKENGIVIPETIKYGGGTVDYDHPPALDLSKVTLPSRPTINPEYLSIERVADTYIEIFESLV